MDRFDAMRVFVRVVEAGSFTKAAETLFISRATATQLVQQLEARLGVKLLNRTTRKVNLTADGAAYHERVVRLLADLDDTEATVSGASSSPRGRLRVDVPSPLARSILLPALPAFHARYPDIQLHLGVSDRVVDLIDENVDCVLRGGELKDQSLVARHVGDLVFRGYASPDYLERSGTPTRPEALERPPHHVVGFIWPRFGAAFALPLKHAQGRQVEIRSRYVVAVDDGNAYLAAGLAGLGALWLPDFVAGPHRARGELVPLLEDWHHGPMPLHLAYRPTRHMSRRLRVFIDWIAELMAVHAPVLRQRRPAP